MQVSLNIVYDSGYVTRNRAGTESLANTRSRIENNMESVYFPKLYDAFASQCDLYLVLSTVSPYTSEADTCATSSGINSTCQCIADSSCVLNWYDNPSQNNISVGFLHNCHHKSMTRLRNNMIVGCQAHTIRIAYTGHKSCFYSSDGHEYNVIGLSDYDNPIICMRVDQRNIKNSILVLAHELTHSYGITHHAPRSTPCIMDSNRYTYNDPNDPTTFWCQECINTIRANRTKY